ncbi:MAG: fibronectin type III domain-containing protein [Oscillospiraceae bacterium]|nr:fibronectin type III domain-containing protein [Oscillospiraceae bacterium]
MKRFTAGMLSVMMSLGAVTAVGEVSDTAAVYAASVDAPSNISVSADKTSVTISWDDEPGASAYRVYQYNASTKKYVKVKTVKGTSAKITGLKEGKKYYFKVASLVKSGSSYKLAGTSDKITATPKAKTSAKTSQTKAKTTTNPKKQTPGELPKFPKLASTSFRESGVSATEVKKKFEDDFEHARLQVITLGYKIKPTDSSNDGMNYVGEYEVRYDGTHVYNLYEQFQLSGKGGSGSGWIWIEDLNGNVVWGTNRVNVVKETVSLPKFSGITTTAFTEYGSSQSVVEDMLRQDFEKVRSAIVTQGYNIKPLSSKVDTGSYHGVYEVRYDGEQVYTYHESYTSNASSGTGWIWIEDMSGNVIVGVSNGTSIVIYY